MAINSADVKHEVIRYMNNLARKNGVRMDWIRVNEFGSRYRYVFSDISTTQTIVEYEIDFKEVDDIFDCVYEIGEALKNKATSYYACRGGYTYVNVGLDIKPGVDISKYIKKAVDESLYPRTMIGAYGRLTRTYASGQYLPEIKDVIFNDPATIIFWQDGDKTVVKAQDGDEFDPEKGLAMAIAKKAFGNKGNYCEKLKAWLEPYEVQPIMVSCQCSMGEALKKLSEQARNAAKSLTLKKEDEKQHSNTWCAYNRLWNAYEDRKATKKDLYIAMKDAINWLAEDINK